MRLDRAEKRGLYDPSNEHDACGVAFVATLRGYPGRDIVDAALTALAHLDHRGGVGSEENTGDGAGILTQMPHEFLAATSGLNLPAHGSYAVGTAFLPTSGTDRAAAVRAIEQTATEEGLNVLGWRDVPVDDSMIGRQARDCMPVFRQLFVTLPAGSGGLTLERRAFRLRRRAENHLGVYFASLSSRTIVYKGMLTTGQLRRFFPDLEDPRFATRLAIVHSRFSTNTFPSWPLAQPFRLLAHNGEINTIRGNRNWMAARQGSLASDLLGDLTPLGDINSAGASDSASFDEVVELLHLAGRSLPHAMLMMVPEAWQHHRHMAPDVRAFYEYMGTIMEPWDGPAALTFTDGSLVGAMLDRNGLRPGRYWITDDGLVVLASETGVIDVPAARVIRRGRLEPGRMFLVDTEAGQIVDDDELKSSLALAHPYQEWLDAHLLDIDALPEREHVSHTRSSVARRQQTFGYTEEELRILLAPMATTGAEALGAMGSDTPIAVLSKRPRLLFDYFSQMFAQVTNPPLDYIREELVTSIGSVIGPEPNLLADIPEHARKLRIPFPVIDNDTLARIVNVGRARDNHGFSAVKLRGLYRVSGGAAALEDRIAELCAEVDRAIEEGASFMVLSDRESTAELAPIPSLLLLAAVHHHTLRNRTRTRISLLVEAGDVREVHHVALLIGYGAAAVNPYLAMESVENLVVEGLIPVTAEQAVANLITALGKGVLKVMSKMGISTLASYRAAQVFQAIGLEGEVIERYFTGTPSPLGGVGLDVIAREVAERHRTAYPRSGISPAHRTLGVGGEYQWRREGELHLLDPETIFRLQHATRAGREDIFREYTARVNEQSERLLTLRGLFRLRGQPPIPLEEVEPVEAILRRFSTGAMSYGSISQEAHETLAIAMNRLGAKSNTGEGGEAPERLHDPERRSAIKQVASGRFGVTADYLTNADDIQIKMAQGAKPGEGGQLPGHKVYPWIARTRHSTPGVGLISPPPHHDIYSIEDLKQLIHDLRCASPRARIHVKLASEVGVGTVAAGVAKCRADVILISGHDGGTGAAPLTSLKHAGGPWELGLAETQQTLVLNNLRDRVVVQTDGQLRTGRDVVVAALLGAEEFGFATSALVVAGCVMMRVCHKDTCPVGVATQNPELRARFTGRPEYVENFFRFLAAEVREILASLGLRSIDDAVGRVDLLDVAAAVGHWKTAGLDLAPLLEKVDPAPGSAVHFTRGHEHGLEDLLDAELIERARPALERGERVSLACQVRNEHRTVGTMLSHEVTRRYGATGLPPDTIDVTLTGSAGQSFGAFLAPGVTLRLRGDANDHLGKGLSGGRIVVRPETRVGDGAVPPDGQIMVRPEARVGDGAGPPNVITGNVVGYGATSGEILLAGLAGERFAVRNSGATLGVEGVGDHACEYMTGGAVLILGPTGRNLAAGMSGGVAYILDLDPTRVNQQALSSGELRLGPLDEEDEETVADLLHLHAELTGSPLAAALLEPPPGPAEALLEPPSAQAGPLPQHVRGRFTRVVPRAYAAARAILTQAETNGAGIEDPTVWQQLMEVGHG